MAVAKTDGRHDFDFALGRWRVHHRKIADIPDPACANWVKFDATSEMRPILRGLGNFDTFVPLGLPAEHSFAGATLRMFDPGTGLWRIRWMPTRAPGRLDTPVEGRFTGGHGQFFCDDVVAGAAVRVRYDWFDLAPGSARWDQSFSHDQGATRVTNWIMTSTREAEL